MTATSFGVKLSKCSRSTVIRRIKTTNKNDASVGVHSNSTKWCLNAIEIFTAIQIFNLAMISNNAVPHVIGNAIMTLSKCN